MAASSSSRNREPRAAAVADVAEGSTSTRSRLDAVSQAILAPFTHRKTDSNKLLSDRTSCAPLLTHARPDHSCSPASCAGDYDPEDDQCRRQCVEAARGHPR